MLNLFVNARRDVKREKSHLTALFVVGLVILVMPVIGVAQSACPTAVEVEWASSEFGPWVALQGGSADVPLSGVLRWVAVDGQAADWQLFFGIAGSACNRPTPTQSIAAAAGGMVDFKDLTPGLRYELRIKGTRAGCQIDTGCVTFSTICPTGPLQLDSPPNGAHDNHLRAILSWYPILGASSYDVTIDGNTINVPRTQTEYPAGGSAQAFPAGNHTWSVKANFPECPPVTSATRSFSTACPIHTPTPLGPFDGEILPSPNVKFEWVTMPDADRVEIFVGRDGATPTLVATAPEGSSSRNVTLDGPGQYVWFIDAPSTGCETKRSVAVPFEVADFCPTTSPVPTFPADGATDVASPVIFQWDPIPAIPSSANFLGYDLFVSTDGGAFTKLATTSATSFEQRLVQASYAWYVEARFRSCPNLKSATNTFTVPNPPNCPTEGPALETPAPGATGVASPVTFGWSAVSGVSFYRIWAGANGETPTLLGEPETNSFQQLLPEGTVTWYVEAIAAGCLTRRSADGSFTTAAPTCPSTQPSLVLPADGGSISRPGGSPPITFAWDDVPFATSYVVNITGDSTATLGSDFPSASGVASALDAGTYQWTVTANFDGCPPVTSAPRSFTVTVPPPCALTPAVVTGPAATTADQLVTVSWDAVPGAVRYEVWSKPGAGTLYTLRGTTSETSLALTFDFGFHDVRVHAYGEPFCTPSISPERRFEVQPNSTCAGLTPAALTAPDAGSTVPTPVQFSWQGSRFAERFQVLLGSGGGSFTPISEGPSHLTSETNMSYLVRTGKWQWKVTSLASGCPSVTSDPKSFEITDCVVEGGKVAVPTILSPTSGALTAPLYLYWTPVRGATKYNVFANENWIASIDGGGEASAPVRATVSPQTGPFDWYVVAVVPGCAEQRSGTARVEVVSVPCAEPLAPTLSLPANVYSGQSYELAWDPVPNALVYEVEESPLPSFADVSRVSIGGQRLTFSHSTAATSRRYYRVRARSACDPGRVGPWSQARTVTINPEWNVGTFGSEQILQQTVFVPGFPGASFRFTTRTDQPWATVKPASGTLGPDGVTIQLFADPAAMQLGSNQATIFVDFEEFAKSVFDAPPPLSVPVVVTLAESMKISAKEPSAGGAFIVPAAAAAAGANDSVFRTDVWMANVSPVPQSYEIWFTQSGIAAAKLSSSVTVQLQPGETVTFADILAEWFGVGDDPGATGWIEIRPLDTALGTAFDTGSAASPTIVTSRTYNVSDSGTFGQHVPSVRFDRFVGAGDGALSFQQISESSGFRTNIGIVEASGRAARVRVTVYGSDGAASGSLELDVSGGQHVQLNGLEQTVVPFVGSRIEVEVISGEGRITAYASVLDNLTNDPSLVPPVFLPGLAAGDTTLPGIADFATGLATWRSDVRLFNPDAASWEAKLTFRPQGGGTPIEKSVTIAPGGVETLDDVLRTTFGVGGVGGSLHVDVPDGARVVATARTYNRTASGTYGQFIPGVRGEATTRRNESPLQLIHAEESPGFRTNVGLVEVGGSAVVVELTAHPPAGEAPRSIRVPLEPYGFIQQVQLLKTLGFENAYNVRVSVAVVEGDGAVAAYASVIDNRTQDPTYVEGAR